MRGADKDLRKFSIDILRPGFGRCSRRAVFRPRHGAPDINGVVIEGAIENIGFELRAPLADTVLTLALESTQPMAICAEGLEALALIGTEQTLDCSADRNTRMPPRWRASTSSQLLKLLGGTAGPESIDEICRVMAVKGQLHFWKFRSIPDSLKIASRLQPSSQVECLLREQRTLRSAKAGARCALGMCPPASSVVPWGTLRLRHGLRSRCCPGVNNDDRLDGWRWQRLSHWRTLPTRRPKLRCTYWGDGG